MSPAPPRDNAWWGGLAALILGLGAMAVVITMIVTLARSNTDSNRQEQITKRARIAACVRFETSLERIACLNGIDR